MNEMLDDETQEQSSFITNKENGMTSSPSTKSNNNHNSGIWDLKIGSALSKMNRAIASTPPEKKLQAVAQSLSKRSSPSRSSPKSPEKTSRENAEEDTKDPINSQGRTKTHFKKNNKDVRVENEEKSVKRKLAITEKSENSGSKKQPMKDSKKRRKIAKKASPSEKDHKSSSSSSSSSPPPPPPPSVNHQLEVPTDMKPPSNSIRNGDSEPSNPIDSETAIPKTKKATANSRRTRKKVDSPKVVTTNADDTLANQEDEKMPPATEETADQTEKQEEVGKSKKKRKLSSPSSPEAKVTSLPNKERKAGRTVSSKSQSSASEAIDDNTTPKEQQNRKRSLSIDSGSSDSTISINSVEKKDEAKPPTILVTEEEQKSSSAQQTSSKTDKEPIEVEAVIDDAVPYETDEKEESANEAEKSSVTETEEPVSTPNSPSPSSGSDGRREAVKKKPKSFNRRQQWKMRFDELLEHQKKHGNLIPPRQTSLSNWVSLQRRLKRKNELEPDCISQLEKIGFQWDGRSVAPPKSNQAGKRRQEQWKKFFEEYKTFKETNGRPPKARTPLYYWAVRQGLMHKKGSLSEDQIQKLKSIGLCSE